MTCTCTYSESNSTESSSVRSRVVLGDIKPIVVAPNGDIVVVGRVVENRVVSPVGGGIEREPNDVPAKGEIVVDGWTVRVPDVDV